MTTDGTRRAGAGAIRWYLKKVSRKGLALGAGASGWAARRDRREAPLVRVLTYHRFGDERHAPFCVRVEDFEAQMGWLAAQGLAVSLAAVEACVQGRRSLAPRSVLVTIDDGLQSLYDAALPVLRRHRIPAVAFIPAAEVDRREPGAFGEGTLGWDAIGALGEAGVTIGSHSWRHRSLGDMTAEEIREEVERSREILERRIGRPVTAFAYPFGTRADFNPIVARALREAGYTCAFTSQHGAVRAGLDPFALPRIKVEGGERLWTFRLLVRGGLDGWEWVDRNLWRLQQREA